MGSQSVAGTVKEHKSGTLVIKIISTSEYLLSYFSCKRPHNRNYKAVFCIQKAASMGLTFAVKNSAKQMNTARTVQSANVWNLLPSFGKKIMKLYNSLGIFSLALLSLFAYEHYVNLTQKYVLWWLLLITIIIAIQYKLKLIIIN